METDISAELRIDLPGGLVLRRATPADIEGLLDINGQLLGEDSRVEIKFLIEGGVPGLGLADFLVVVEPGGRVVSSLSLLTQELRVGRTVLKIGNPEFVSTLPEYRGGGIIRRLFAVLEQLQKERGLAISAIMGIPYFYRLFGYEYALEDFRQGFLTPNLHREKMAAIPDLEVRRAVESDAPLLAKMYAETAAQADIALLMAESGWAWAARTRELEANNLEDWVALEKGRLIAYARLHLKGNTMAIFRLTGELAGQQALIKKALDWPSLEKLGIGTFRNNPLTRWVASLGPERRPSYANYVRIIDPALAFRQLGPELESRLAASPFAGLSREVELGFYRFGVALTFEEGKLVRVEARPGHQSPAIGIPPDLLPKILMGFRSLDELAGLFPDFIVPEEEDWTLLQILFPPLTDMINFFF
jgi:GNAT superfamily N-acetyltransferase